MKIEIRSDCVSVSGYVNAVERDSRVLPAGIAAGADTPFVEKVAAGAFAKAIAKNPDIRMLFNHEREVGSVGSGSLKLREDNIGLYAEATVSDAEVVGAARRGELRGWSFGFSSAKADWEEVRAGMKRRILQEFDLGEVSILTKTPAYYGTSVETRSEDAPLLLELRHIDDPCDKPIEPTQPPEEKRENKEAESRSKAALDVYKRELEILSL